MPTTPGRPPLGEQAAVMGAVLGKEKPAGTNIPNKPTTSEQAADLIRHKMREGTPDSALEAIKGWKEPLQVESLREVVDENFGTERDPSDGKKMRSTVEQQRFKKAERQINQMDKLLREGFDKLSPTEQTALRTSVEASLLKIPAVNAYLNGITNPADREAALNRIIQNPKYAETVRRLLQDRVLGEGDGDKIIEDTVTEAKAKEADAKAEETAAQEELDELDTEFLKVDAGIEEFKPAMGGAAAGSRYKDIDPTEIAKTNSDTVAKGKQVDAADRNLLSLKKQLDVAQKARNLTEVTRLESAVKKAQGRKDTLQKELDKLQVTQRRQQEAQADQKRLQQERKDLVTRKRELEKAQRNAKRALDTAQLTLARALSKRDRAERKFAESIDKVAGDAAIETFQQEVQKAEAVQQELLEKAKAEAKTAEEKAVLEAIASRYERIRVVHPPFGRERQVRVLNRRRVREDFELLTMPKIAGAPSGPEQVMREVLERAGITGANQDRAMADTDFVNKMQPKLIQRLVAKRLQAGRMRESDVRTIVDSDWGEGVIEGAIQSNEKVRTMIDKLRETGQIQGPFINFLRSNNVGSVMSWIALLLLGGVPALAGLIPMDGS